MSASGSYSAADVTPAEALRHGGADDVRAALLAVRARTLALADDYFVALGTALRVPQRAELNPPLWELGHVAWFQEWWIARNPRRDEGTRCDPDAARSAAARDDADACYDSSRIAHATRWGLPLPDLEGTRRYLAQTLERTLDLLDALPPDAGDDALYFFRLAVLHEAMHAEAAVYMARTLAIPVRDVPARRRHAGAEQLDLPAQRFALGAAAGGFAFDNELCMHEVDIGAVQVDAHAVTWERFLPFVQAGGYSDPQWWSDAGRSWLAKRDPVLPVAPRDPRAPVVHVTLHEAQAWCRWAGRRLPTEAEWECAALTLPGFAWGDVWEWTASPFLPYPGFAPHPYRDYSAPWFGTRQVLRGACAATSDWLAHPRYRNFFEAGRNDIFAGFRSCRDA